MTTRILAVEDQPNWQTILKKILSPPKYELQIVQTKEDAELLIRRGAFDVVIVNMNLMGDPDFQQDQLGLEVLEFIQREYPALPRIVITGEPGGPIFSRFAPFGVSDVLIKSQFNRAQLAETIESAVNQRRAMPPKDSVTTAPPVGGGNVTAARTDAPYDVFFAYNAEERRQVDIIADALKQRGISVWLDTDQISPGSWVKEVIQTAIPRAKSAAIFIGNAGLGRWEALELHAFISQCINSRIPVIPVLLPGVKTIPEPLLFLKEFHAVSFTTLLDAEALNNLQWGITGTHPAG